MSSFALYIHVPFCAQKCPYCDFNTYAVNRVPDVEYTTSLIAELDTWARDARLAGRPVSSIFFGGGTPSLLSSSSLRSVIDRARSLFGVAPGAEVTLEANPSSPSADLYKGFLDAGINRLSFGVQSFNDRHLSLLGRDHTPSEAQEAVRLAHVAGFENVSIDLIFGVSGQTLRELEGDLDTAAVLPISHLSTYALTIEPGTPFYQRQERGLLSPPKDDLVAEMLAMIPERLQRHSFERYEISNYARQGMTSKHNEGYWLGGDYLGIGAGAHSYIAQYEGEKLVKAERWSTLAQPAAYMKGASEGRTVSWRDALESDALMFEFFYVGLRRTPGVSLKEFRSKFGIEAVDRYKAPLVELERDGFISLCGERVQLTDKGIALADSVYEQFL
jgi:oxygen-independent coproporphyrinogen-3 oxidase